LASSTAGGSECSLVGWEVSACNSRGISAAVFGGGAGRQSIGGRNGSESVAFGETVRLRELDWGSD